MLAHKFGRKDRSIFLKSKKFHLKFLGILHTIRVKTIKDSILNVLQNG